MKKKTFLAFQKELIQNGYKRTNSLRFEKDEFAYYKAFGKSTLEENRCNYQIFFEVYDWSKFPQCAKSEPYSIELNILISRHTDERVDIVNSDIKTIVEAEKFAAAMFEAFENYNN